MSTATERLIIRQLEHLKEEVAVIKQMLLSQNNRHSAAAILTEGINLPLNSLQDIETTENKLKDQACFSDMVHLICSKNKFFDDNFFFFTFFI